MRKAIKWTAIALGGVIAIAGLGAVYIAATFNPNDYKAQIIRAVKEKTGRTLELKGDLKLAFYPSIGAKVAEASLSEQNSDKIFAAFKEALVSVKVMPLLGKQVVIDAIEAKGLHASIRRDKSGKMNFDDLTGGDKKKPEEKTPSPVKIDIDHVALTDSDVTFFDEAGGVHYRVEKLNVKTGRIAPGVTTPIDFSALVSSDKQKAALDTKLKAKLTLDAEHQTYKAEGLELSTKGKYGDGELHVKLDAPKVSITKDRVEGTKVALELSLNDPKAKRSVKLAIDGLQGTFTDFKAAPLDAEIELQADGRTTKAHLNATLNGNLETKRFELPKLALTAKVTDPKLPKGSFDASINGSARADLSKDTAGLDFTGKIEDSQVNGKAAVTKFSPLTLTFDFNADALDVDRLLGKSQAAKPAESKESQAPAVARGTKDEKIDLSALNGVNAAGNVKIAKLNAFNIKSSQLSAGIKLANGRLDVSPISAHLYDGTMSGSLSAQAGTASTFAIRQSLVGVAVGPLLRDAAQIDNLDGKGNVSVDVTTTGATVDALKHALAGTAAISLAEGALKGIDIAGTIRAAREKLQQVRGQQVQQSNKSQKTDFSELKATFNVRNGVANNNDLSMKSPLLRVAGAGNIDIGNDRMDYVLKPTLVATSKGEGGKDRSDLTGLTVPVKLTGPIASPQYSIDFAGMVTDVVKGRIQDEIMKRIPGQAPAQADGKSKPAGGIGDQIKGIFGR